MLGIIIVVIITCKVSLSLSHHAIKDQLDNLLNENVRVVIDFPSHKSGIYINPGFRVNDVTRYHPVRRQPPKYNGPDRLTIHSIGDSHSRWQCSKYLSKCSSGATEIARLDFECHCFLGKLMYSVGKNGLDFLNIPRMIKGRMGDRFKLNPLNDVIVLTFGEVDVRAQIPKRVNNIEEGKKMIKDIVLAYERVLEENLKMLPKGMVLWIAELIPSAGQDHIEYLKTQNLTTEDTGVPILGSDDARIAYTRCMNDELRGMCSRHPKKMLFLDFFHDPHANANGTLKLDISDKFCHVDISSEYTQQRLLELLSERRNAIDIHLGIDRNDLRTIRRMIFNHQSKQTNRLQAKKRPRQSPFS